MRAWRCAVCQKPVTEVNLKQGVGKIVNKKVYCVDHVPEVGAAAPAARSSSRRARQRAPEQAEGADIFDDDGDDFQEEGGGGKTGLILAIFGVVILGLIGVVVFLMMGDDPAQAPITAGPETPDGPPEPAEPGMPGDTQPPEPDMPPEPDEPGMPAGPTEADYQAVIAKADTSFDGSIPGFLAGERIVKAGIIENGAFKDSEFIKTAEEYLEDKRDPIEAEITKNYSAIRQEASKMVVNLKHKEALQMTESFPDKYRRFGEWGRQYETMREDIRSSAASQVQGFLDQAQARIDDGKSDQAVAQLKEILELGTGKMLPELEDKLRKNIGLIEAGGSIGTGTKDPTSAAALLKQADRDYIFGRPIAAERVYSQLMKSFAADEDVVKARGRISERLGEIGKMKAAGKDDELRVLLYSDFEEVWSTGKHGNFWKSGARQQVKTFAKHSKYALKCTPKEDEKYAAVAARGGMPSDMSAWVNDDNAYFSFWYLLEGKQPSAKGHSLYVQCMNRTQSDNFNFRMNDPVMGKWTYVCIPLAWWRDNEHAGKKPKQGDQFSGIGISYGRPGEDYVLYVDEVAVVSGSSLYYLQEKIAAKVVTIDKITSNLTRDFYRMDIQILENAVARAGAGNDRKTVLAVGGLHVGSNFLNRLSKETGAKLKKVKGAGAAQSTIAAFFKEAASELPKKKPGVVVFMLGINDVINSAATKKPIEGFEQKLNAMVEAALEHGCIPVLCNMPASYNDEYKMLVTDINVAINNVARMNYVPYIDAYNMFSREKKAGKLYQSNGTALKRAGFDRINARFYAIMKTIQEYAFK